MGEVLGRNRALATRIRPEPQAKVAKECTVVVTVSAAVAEAVAVVAAAAAAVTVAAAVVAVGIATTVAVAIAVHIQVLLPPPPPLLWLHCFEIMQGQFCCMRGDETPLRSSPSSELRNWITRSIPRSPRWIYIACASARPFSSTVRGAPFAGSTSWGRGCPDEFMDRWPRCACG